MLKIKEAIVVEGKYDKNTISQVIDAPVFVTSGFGVMKDKEQLALLRRVAEKRGLIVFTDSDGAGFVIRNHLKSAIPASNLKHAYIPDVFGKERRKAVAGKEGKLGVEGMTPEIIIDCLKRAGATFTDDEIQTVPTITKQDFYELGLSGGADSKQRRKQLLAALHFPEHMSANALLQAVSLLYSTEELKKILDSL